MFRRTFCLGLLFATFFSPIASAQNLLVNGSFEAGNFVPNSEDIMSLPAGSTNMTGWTTYNEELAWERVSSPETASYTPSDGSFFLDLTGYHDVAPYGGVNQNISTEQGVRHRFVLDLGTNQSQNPGLGPISVLATAGDTSQSFTHNPSGSGMQWLQFGFEFTANSNMTTISIVGTSAARQFIGLDNISVSHVPAPGALAAFVMGAVPGAAVLLRRRRKA